MPMHNDLWMKIVNFVFFEHPKYLLSVVGLTQILPSRNVNGDGEFFFERQKYSSSVAGWLPLGALGVLILQLTSWIVWQTVRNLSAIQFFWCQFGEFGIGSSNYLLICVAFFHTCWRALSHWHGLSLFQASERFSTLSRFVFYR